MEHIDLTNEEFERIYRNEERDISVRRQAFQYDYEHWSKTGELREKIILMPVSQSDRNPS